MPAEKVQKKTTSASEIDDIFAKKTLPSKKQTGEATDNSTTATKNKKKKKSVKFDEKDIKKDEEKKEEEPAHEVEEVVFAELTAAKKGQKRKAPQPPSNDDGFGDSRGKKTKRTTEDGYPLYDVKDLRIGEGKDTPQCPFECDCCY